MLWFLIFHTFQCSVYSNAVQVRFSIVSISYLNNAKQYVLNTYYAFNFSTLIIVGKQQRVVIHIVLWFFYLCRTQVLIYFVCTYLLTAQCISGKNRSRTGGQNQISHEVLITKRQSIFNVFANPQSTGLRRSKK